MAVTVNGTVFKVSTDGAIYGKYKDGAPAIPLAPTNFAVVYNSDTSLTLDCQDNSDNETGFEFDRSLTGTGGWSNVTTTPANTPTHIDTGLTVDTQYFYRVRAVNTFGESTYATANGTTTEGVTSTPNLFSTIFDEDSFAAPLLEGAVTSTLNTGNFAWDSSNTVNIVEQDGADNNSHWPGGFFTNTTTTDDWTAKEGTYSLLFDYGVGNDGMANMSEQRFSIDDQNELWVRYWIKVPENYAHGSEEVQDNNKFLSLWFDEYLEEAGGTGSTVVLSMESAGGGDTDLAFTYTDHNLITQPFLQITPFIDASVDRGRWMQLVVHVVYGTEATSDSTIQTYRRWENEQEFTQLHSLTTASLTKGSATGWGGGYFMGWSNGGYAEKTFFRIDEVELSTGSLL